MKKLFFSALVAVVAGFAQTPTNVSSVQIFNAITTAPSVSGLLPNVGQSQHLATVVLTNAPAKSCVSQNVDIAFNASRDNVIYFEIGSAVTSIVSSASGANVAIIEADGFYPYVTLNVRSFDTTNCVLSAWYSGTYFPNPAAAAIPPKAATRGMHYRSFQKSGSGDNTIISALNTSRFTCIYGLQFFNGVSTAQTVGIKDSGTGVFTTVQFPAAASPSGYVIGPSPVAFFCLARGDDLVLNLSAATLVSGTIQYRYEDNPQ